MNNGNINNNNKTNTNRVRACSAATLPIVYDIPFSSIIDAWIDCERNKLTSNACTKFRFNAHTKLVKVWEDCRRADYRPGIYVRFCVAYPVKREIFAATFSDRVVQHYVGMRLIPILEELFNECGNVSMNCRKGYGVLQCVNKFERMLYDFSFGYTEECWILGGDFSNFFMGLDKAIVWEMIQDFVLSKYQGTDIDFFLYLLRVIIFDEPQTHCVNLSDEKEWEGMPKRKSLMYAPKGYGVPLGNLPSQLICNFVASAFDWWIMKVKGYEEHLRFVDDFRVLLRTRGEAEQLIREIRSYLAEQLHITLHPHKITLQHYAKGTLFTGAVVRPGRVYVSNRTRGRFIDSLIRFNALHRKPCERIAALEELRSTVNSYLGLMSHYNSYNVRKSIIEKYILPYYSKYVYFTEGYRVMKIKLAFDKGYIARKALRHHDYAARYIRPVYSE